MVAQLQREFQGALDIILVAGRHPPIEQQIAALVAKIHPVEVAFELAQQVEDRLHKDVQVLAGLNAL